MSDIVASESNPEVTAVSRSERPGGNAEKLATDQQAALEYLLAGKSISETARSAGVSRGTVYYWLRHDPAFQAAYNRWHDEMEESCRSRLLMLSDKATTAIEKALEAGDARSGLQLLKGMGLIGPRVPRPTEAEEVAARSELEKKERRIALERDSAKLFWKERTAPLGLDE